MKTLVKFTFILLLSFSSVLAWAQSQSPQSSVLNQNDWLLSGGVMVGQGGMLPFVANVEKGAFKNISVGGRLIRVSAKDELFGDKISLTVVGATANYHAAQLLKLTNTSFDPYAGATLGLGFISWDGEMYTTPPLFNLQVGARYYFSKSLAGYSQLNFGASDELGVLLEFGLTYRLRR